MDNESRLLSPTETDQHFGTRAEPSSLTLIGFYLTLNTHPSLSNREDVKETAAFIRSVTDMWNILNVRSNYKDQRRRNPLEAVMTDVPR